MYAGRKVEEAGARDLFATPRHPYTRGLIAAVPRLGSSLADPQGRLAEIPGTVPDLSGPLKGCVFASRCREARDVCRIVTPALEAKAAAHFAACHFAPTEAAAA